MKVKKQKRVETILRQGDVIIYDKETSCISIIPSAEPSLRRYFLDGDNKLLVENESAFNAVVRFLTHAFNVQVSPETSACKFMSSQKRLRTEIVSIK
ncbi:MAG: hypothetical protein A2288_02075 [Candidatus Moranbacteria bacterium RIFOXYA12_FULL_44_15]|nr:MAG: hypothetical protein A2288_02075 [Candidatus Moranbacteria bacterium RIFOXYA12_FULL_44_15]OGI35901.1 MAG: hypothetical protein A2259_04970 [Candidatus Moranbacteria bacterium RIFOXYA2_FULL_43_15]